MIARMIARNLSSSARLEMKPECEPHEMQTVDGPSDSSFRSIDVKHRGRKKGDPQGKRKASDAYSSNPHSAKSRKYVLEMSSMEKQLYDRKRADTSYVNYHSKKLRKTR